MLVPMFEKYFGPDAANSITAAPFDQMKQMVQGTLSQMESPDAQAYFQNDPAFPSRLETLRRANALIEYLDVDSAPEELPSIPQPAN